MAEQQEYWFNFRTKEVEVGKQSAALFRAGPFSTREEAANAEKLLAERAAAWRAEEDREERD
jgi:hypothetical protein